MTHFFDNYNSDEPDFILASRSAARISMLQAVGLRFDAQAADIPELDFIKDNGHLNAFQIAEMLAEKKSLCIAQRNPAIRVVGSDQTLECEGRLLSKARNIEEARKKLDFLSGKTHYLHSSVCIHQGNQILWKATDTAKLTMHDMSDEFMDRYIMDAGKEVLTGCVGGYAIEKHGPWLFSEVEGNHFTILGMPLLPLLSYFQSEGLLWHNS